MKRVIYIILFGLMMLSLTGCAHTGLVAGDKAPEVEIDRSVYIEGENTEELLVKVNSEYIDSFVEKYNELQTVQSLKVSNHYRIYKDNNGIYYVKSSKTDLTIWLGTDGRVVRAAMSNSESVDEHLLSAQVIFDVINYDRNYIPEEQLAYIAKLNRILENKGYKIEAFSKSFSDKINGLDTTLLYPDALPELTALPGINFSWLFDEMPDVFSDIDTTIEYPVVENGDKN